MKAAEFMAGFSSAGRSTEVTLNTVSVASSADLKARIEQMEGFAHRSGCPLMSWERDLCAAIRAELAVRS